MPRRVVPIWRFPSFRSRAPSSATCHGMIRCALPERKTRPAVTWPRPSRSSSSPITTSRVDDAAGADRGRLAGDDPGRDLRGSCTSRRRRRSCALRSAHPGSGRRGRSPGRAGRRSCPCPRRPTAHRRSRWQARAPFLHAAGRGVPRPPTRLGSPAAAPARRPPSVGAGQVAGRRARTARRPRRRDGGSGRRPRRLLPAQRHRHRRPPASVGLEKTDAVVHAPRRSGGSRSTRLRAWPSTTRS